MIPYTIIKPDLFHTTYCTFCTYHNILSISNVYDTCAYGELHLFSVRYLCKTSFQAPEKYT